MELQHLLLIVRILLLYDSNIDLPNLNMITIIDESFKNVTSLSIGTLNSLEMIVSNLLQTMLLSVVYPNWFH